MNRVLIAILIAFSLQACAQEKVVLEKPTVDKKVELLSIVFRLAEKQEYSYIGLKPYVGRIEQYFEKYKNHELIQFTKSIISENGIAYDGPMWMAFHLDDNLELLADVKDVWQHDPRWTKENTGKFIPLLQKFYKDTRFDEFFKDNTDLYADAVKRFTVIYEQVDLDWLYSFYGKEESSDIYLIKIGLGVWGNCYGVNVDYNSGIRKIYAIMGVWSLDNAGLPVFSKIPDLPILMHEFCHPFTDNLTEKNKESFKESGEKIYSVVKNVINAEAYPSWEVFLDEALTQASTIKYMKDHHFEQSEIESLTKWMKEDFGFFWIEELIAELESYDRQRAKYPTLESYMPKLAEAYNRWTENILTSEQ